MYISLFYEIIINYAIGILYYDAINILRFVQSINNNNNII